MTIDRLLTFDQIERDLAIDPSRVARALPFIVAPDGTRSAWLSDVAHAAREAAHKLDVRLRRAEIARLEAACR